METFQDLNLTPPHPRTPTPTPTPSILPKIEPKLEPLDEPPHPPHHPTPTPIPIHTDVYAEYNRITELFRATLAQRFNKNGDVSLLHDLDLDPNAGAIVPFVNPETELSRTVSTPRGPRKYPTRSAELVRVTDLKSDDEVYFRDLMRRTRMLFDSLRVFAVAMDERAIAAAPHRRTRGDLKAAALMRQCDKWLNRDKRIVGEIPGISIGDVYFFRMEMLVVGMHGQAQAGIDYVSAGHSSNGEPIATSVIVSGGYEDDMDAGDVIVYTGHGGQDKHNKQVEHQKLESGNLAMERSMNYGVEVRVIRGFKYDGSPSGKVYVYDGLYRIVETWFDTGKSGFGVYKFKLVRIENQVEMGSSVLKFAQRLRSRPLEARPNGYVTLDLSKKKENVPVLFYNDIDQYQDPIYYEYLVSSIYPQFVYNSLSMVTGCQCTGHCMDGCICFIKNGGEFPYDHNGVLIRGKPVVFECGPRCHCPPSCHNRVTQKGVRNRLEVFRSTQTGWGVRSLDLIQAGSFVCEYAGVVLTREQAQLFTMNGDTLIYPNRFAERWREWGDLSKIFSDYSCPTYPSIPPLDFAMEVTKMRNVACYMSHSSSPNVFVQLVMYDHNNISFPHLMLFAMENIPPLRELSLDYGVADEWTGKLAICN